MGLVLRRRNGTEKNALLLLLLPFVSTPHCSGLSSLVDQVLLFVLQSRQWSWLMSVSILWYGLHKVACRPTNIFCEIIFTSVVVSESLEAFWSHATLFWQSWRKETQSPCKALTMNLHYLDCQLCIMCRRVHFLAWYEKQHIFRIIMAK